MCAITAADVYQKTSMERQHRNGPARVGWRFGPAAYLQTRGPCDLDVILEELRPALRDSIAELAESLLGPPNTRHKQCFCSSTIITPTKETTNE
jgi:hypothetical protein